MSSKAKVIAFTNQKGGVAKTTTTLNLAAAFVERGHRVLCVDLDPQAQPHDEPGHRPRLARGVDVRRARAPRLAARGDPQARGGHRLRLDRPRRRRDRDVHDDRPRALAGRRALLPVKEDYDYVFIDTPPSLGLLTINALTASDKVIVPVQCEYLSMRGLIQLQNTLSMVREELNPDIEIEGILPTLVDNRTVHAKEAIEILEENFGERVFASRINKTVRFAEAPVKGMSVLKYDPDGKAAYAYRQLAEEVLANGKR